MSKAVFIILLVIMAQCAHLRTKKESKQNKILTKQILLQQTVDNLPFIESNDDKVEDNEQPAAEAEDSTPMMSSVIASDNDEAPMTAIDSEVIDYIRPIDQMELDGDQVDVMFEAMDMKEVATTVFAQMSQETQLVHYDNVMDQVSHEDGLINYQDPMIQALEVSGAPLATHEIVNDQPVFHTEAFIQIKQHVKEQPVAPMQSEVPAIDMTAIFEDENNREGEISFMQLSQVSELTLGQQIANEQVLLTTELKAEGIEIQPFDYSDPTVQELEAKGAPLEDMQIAEAQITSSPEPVSFLQVKQLIEEPLSQQILEAQQSDVDVEPTMELEPIDYNDAEIIALEKEGIPMAQTEEVKSEFVFPDEPSLVQLRQQEQQVIEPAVVQQANESVEGSQVTEPVTEETITQQLQDKVSEETKVQEPVVQEIDYSDSRVIQAEEQGVPMQVPVIEPSQYDLSEIITLEVQQEIDTSMPLLYEDTKVAANDINLSPPEQSPQQMESLESQTQDMVQAIEHEESQEILQSIEFLQVVGVAERGFY